MSYEDIVKMWKGFHIQDSVQLGAYLENFSVLFSYHSGKIENENITYHDTREIFENGRVINYTGDLKTLYEIENMKSAYKLMMNGMMRMQILHKNESKICTMNLQKEPMMKEDGH